MLQKQLKDLKRIYDLDQQGLTEGLDTFHLTASPVARIVSASGEITALKTALCTPVVKQFDWMCAPIYRDALVFYSEQDELLSVLNICFGCDRMLTQTGDEIEADATTCEMLKQYLTQLGHPIVER